MNGDFQQHNKEPKTWKNILCIRSGNLGDVLMTTPAFSAIKESLPNVRITLLTSKSGCSIAPLIPEIDKSIAVSFPWEEHIEEERPQEFEYLAQQLKKDNFDAAIIFTVYSQNPFPVGLLCYLAGIKNRIAYTRENPNSLFTHFIPEPEPQQFIQHEVLRQLNLVKMLGWHTANDRLRIKIPERDIRRMFHKLHLSNIHSSKWIVLHPGASVPWRRYKAEELAKAGRILKDNGHTILITGDETEQNLAKFIANEIGSNTFSLAGQLSIPEFAALLSFSNILISNNTGPVHIAAAVKTPIIDLYALTNPQHTPWKVPHRVLYFPIKNKFWHTPSLPLSNHKSLLTDYHDIVRATHELLTQTQAKERGEGMLAL